MSNTWKSPLTTAYASGHHLGTNDGCECANGFADPAAEYHAVRNSVAISDNSHYGKFRVSGADALDVVNQLVMADVARLAIGRATWTFMLREDGSTLCDVYVVCAGDEYLLFSEGVHPTEVHAAMLTKAEEASVKVEDLTQTVALIGLDGPYAWELLKELVGVRMLGLRYLEFLEKQPLGDGNAYVIRAGKTGEFGYQVMVPADQAVTVWNQLHEAGKAFDAQSAGYESLTLCRLENRFINMHREGSATKSPLELNCRVMVDQEKDDYVGCEAITSAMQSQLENRIIGLTIHGDESATPEMNAEISADGNVLGKVVNAGFSPTLGTPIALGLLTAEAAFVGLEFDVSVGGGLVKANSVSAPFIANKSMTVRPQEDSYRAR